MKEIPGILFEEKGPILAVHYRNVSQRYFALIPQVLEEELQQWRGRWKMSHGKMVLEIQPQVDFNKGKAVTEILKTFPLPGLLPIYLGDDQTDEDAFRALKGQGLSVFIGPAGFPSEADYFLENPDEVQEFLSRCHEVEAYWQAIVQESPKKDCKLFHFLGLLDCGNITLWCLKSLNILFALPAAGN